MAISPASGNLSTLSTAATRGASRSIDPGVAAEKEANRRIAEAHDRTLEAEKQEREALDGLRDEYNHQYEAQSARNAEALENEKSNGNEIIQKVKSEQRAELNRVKRDGERDLEALKRFYRDSIYRTESASKQQLDELSLRTNSELEREIKQSDANLDFTRGEHSRRMQTVQNEHDSALAELAENSRKDIERAKVDTANAREMAAQKFQDRMEQSRNEYDVIIHRLNSEAKTDLDSLRRDTSKKLSAYSERQSDPFYQVLDLDADMYEANDGYYLRAKVPLHEQAGISVNVHDNELVLTGRRRNEEKIENEDGSTVGTCSYQSYSKSFPLGFPVQSKELRKTFDGDDLIVFVPKKNTYKPFEAAKAKTVTKAKIERPNFPENIPVAKTETDSKEPEESTKKHPSYSSRTLG